MHILNVPHTHSLEYSELLQIDRFAHTTHYRSICSLPSGLVRITLQLYTPTDSNRLLMHPCMCCWLCLLNLLISTNAVEMIHIFMTWRVTDRSIAF